MASSSEGSGKTGSARLGRLIRDRRKELGMSRQDLADATGVPYPTIAQIETAYRGVSPSRLGVIARALELDPKELYDLLANDPPAQTSVRSRGPAGAPMGLAGGWHVNPAYGGSPSLAAEATSAPTTPDAVPLRPEDVVEQAVTLLSQLSPEQRIDALSRVQSRLLADLVDEQVRRATGHNR